MLEYVIFLPDIPHLFAIASTRVYNKGCAHRIIDTDKKYPVEPLFSQTSTRLHTYFDKNNCPTMILVSDNIQK